MASNTLYVKNGQVFIFSHNQFQGFTDKNIGLKSDEDVIKKKFERLGFKVRDPFRNYTDDKVTEELKKIAKLPESDCIFIFVLTKFNVKGKYLTVTGTYSEDDIVSEFKETATPVIFILHAPKVEKNDVTARKLSNYEVDGAQTVVPINYLPTEANFFIVRSSCNIQMDGGGSFLIHKLCEELNGHLSLDTEVMNALNGIKKKKSSLDDRLLFVPDITSTMVQRIVLSQYSGSAVSKKIPIYDINRKNGFVYIFNYTETFDENLHEFRSRGGTEIDVDKLISTFEDLDFEVEIYNDLEPAAIRTIINTDKDFSQYTCIFVIVLTHGENGKLQTIDKAIETSEVIHSIYSKKTLDDKPKIFILQACRGEELSEKVPYYGPLKYNPYNYSKTTSGNKFDEIDAGAGPSKPKDDNCSNPLLECEDVLVFYASANNKAAVRNTEKGTWFIQNFCNVLKRQTAGNKMTYLYDVIADTKCAVAFKESMELKKQMPVTVSTLVKDMLIGKQI